MEQVRELQPDLLILDKSFGLNAVLDALYGLAKAEPRPSVIVWGANLSDPESLRLLHAGASGLVRKTATLETILACVIAVASGATWMEPGLVRTAAFAARSGRSPLTARELQVADLVERGLSNRDIGRELGIRTGTVKIHLKHIFEKTGVHGRYGLALCGLKQKGLVALPAVM
jgi:DNA-binding NarL/FixJ family response regulator